MSGVEWIGFFISFLAMLYLYFINPSPSKRDVEIETEDNEAELPLQKLYKHVNRIEEKQKLSEKQKKIMAEVSLKESHQLKKPLKKQPQQLQKMSPLPNSKDHKDALDEMLHDKTVEKTSRVNALVKKHSLKEIMVMNQILGVPKGFTE